MLRIDGALSNWHKTGCDYLRVTPKHGYATVDIFMPEETWQGGDRIRISGYLDKYTRTGFQMMLERVLRKNITIDSEALTKDFEASMLEFEQMT